MSGKSASDYASVLRNIIQKFSTLPSITTAILDFEAATWSAFRQVLPHACVRGSSFHCGQAVWRNVQDLGLAVPYMKNANTHKFIRRLLCLLCIPSEHILPLFHSIQHLDNPMTPIATPIHKLHVDAEQLLAASFLVHLWPFCLNQ